MPNAELSSLSDWWNSSSPGRFSCRKRPGFLAASCRLIRQAAGAGDLLLGCVAEWHEFMLRVHEDGSLTAIMERASRQSSGDDGEDGESANEDAESEDDDMFGDDEPSYGFMNGYAWEDEGTGEHDVAFVISVWRPQDGEGADMTCKGWLSARGLTGTYRNLKEHGGVANLYEDEDGAVDGGTDFPFELVAKPEAFSVERLEASCLPLTPGRFSFYGHALTNTLDLLNSDVAMVLRVDGTVTDEIE